MLPYKNGREPTVGNHEATDFAPGWQSYRAFLLVAVSLSTYLYIPLVAGGRLLVPSVITVALIPVLFLAVHRSLSIADKLFLPNIAFVLLLSIACSPGYAYIQEKFLSMVQFCLAVSVTVMTVRLMKQMQREVLERGLLALWCLLLLGSVLELTGLTKGISDAFRAWAYGGTYTLYDGDLRDVSFVGWVRPKVFATEPSAVSKMFIVSINAWLLVRVTRVKAAIVAVGTASMFVIMGSPMFAVSAAITLTVLVWNPRASIRTRVAMVLATLVISVAFLAMFGDTALSTLETRVGNIGATDSTGQLERRSENVRAVAPWIALVNTMGRWPVFGVGFGGKEVIFETRVNPASTSKEAIGGNAVTQVVMYLGVLGGTWFIWLLLRQVSQTGARRLGLMLAIVFLFSMLMGGLDSFRYWGHIALLWGALAVADSNAIGDA